MRIQPKNNALPKVLIGLALVSVLTGGYMLYAKYTDSWPFTVDKSTTTDNEVEIIAGKPVGDTKNTENTDDPTANKPVEFTPEEESNTSASKDNLTGIINHKSISDNQLNIRATINQLLYSGECKLLLTSESGKTVEETADITATASTSTCKGFTIPTSKLTPGKWNIEIILISGEKQGKLTSSIDI